MKDKDDKEVVFNGGAARVVATDHAVLNPNDDWANTGGYNYNSGGTISFSASHDILTNSASSYNFADTISPGVANYKSINVSAMEAITLAGIETNSKASLDLNISNNSGIIDLNGDNSVLIFATNVACNSIISDPNSTGTIQINPNLNVTLNGPLGTTEHPIGTLTVGNDSTLTLTNHLYVNSLTLADGASVFPPEMVHVMGDNVDGDL